MYFLFVLIIAAIIIGLLIATNMELIRGLRGDSADYDRRGTLFTPAERSFLGVLEQALDSRYRVFGKVRLGDLIKPAKDLTIGKRTTAQNRINQKHVDFVVCTANELAPVGVIELDDQSHGRDDRARRDTFVDQALAMSGIPLLRFPAEHGYALQEVRTRLAAMMLASARSGVVPISVSLNPALDVILESTPLQPDSDALACPKCSAVMVKRHASRGQFAGRYFWACSTFPMCRQVVEVGAG